MTRLTSARSAVTPLLLAAAVALSGCAPAGPVVDDADPVETSKDESTPTPTPTPTPDAPLGSRSNPVPSGTAAQHSPDSMWKYTVGATNPNAWAEITATNEFNEPPGEGNSYITVPVHVQALENPAAANGADPWASFKIEYVTAAGNTARPCAAVLPAPGSLDAVGTMYGGAEADFLGCAIVPTADIPGGTWRVGSQIDATSAAFFAGP